MTDEEMHVQSGRVVSDDRVVWQIYTLLRDHVQPGVIERLVDDIESSDNKTATFTNGWLAHYAIDLARRLKEKTT